MQLGFRKVPYQGEVATHLSGERQANSNSILDKSKFTLHMCACTCKSAHMHVLINDIASTCTRKVPSKNNNRDSKIANQAANYQDSACVFSCLVPSLDPTSWSSGVFCCSVGSRPTPYLKTSNRLMKGRSKRTMA